MYIPFIQLCCFIPNVIKLWLKYLVFFINNLEDNLLLDVFHRYELPTDLFPLTYIG